MHRPVPEAEKLKRRGVLAGSGMRIRRAEMERTLICTTARRLKFSVSAALNKTAVLSLEPLSASQRHTHRLARALARTRM
ncbi:hypothetical protein BaRGS_00010351 [Batillaria attramentaria]|uniref:Uncharacterized protein n=1 Tax=Batillaria attramentaria TaxID=370345 RepID=A0ABD0LGE4_9CAEN